MRIAQIAPPWFAVPPERYGGIEWVVALLADGLADRGHDTTLYASGGSKTRAKLVSVFETPPGAEFIGDPWYDTMQAVSAYQNASSFDLVHDHSGLVGPAIGSFVDVPVVHTLHGPFTDDAKQVYTLLSGRIWYVAISEAQRRRRPELPWAATIHNAIDPTGFLPMHSADGPVLWLGRFSTDKGPDLAIQACREAGLPLVLAGKCNEPAEQRCLDEVIRPMLGDDVKLIVNGDRQTTNRLLSEARCLIMPIRWHEPFGMVMIEAFASGTPVVAMRRGSVPEVVRHGTTGFVCDDPSELPAALLRVGEVDPQDCVAHARSAFSADLMARRYERVYRQAIVQSRRSRHLTRRQSAVPAAPVRRLAAGNERRAGVLGRAPVVNRQLAGDR